MRTIDADAFDATMYEAWKNNEITNEEWFHFREMIKDEPTVEPQRMRGKWIEPTEDNDYWECPVCHDTYELDVDVTPQDARLFFCPNCGCQMCGGEEDE